MLNKNQILYLLTFICLTILVNSCASVDTCTEERKNGNLGSLFNSVDDEFSPFIIEDIMYFTSQSKTEQGKEEEILKIDLTKNFKPQVVNDLPLKEFEIAGLPSFFKNKDGNLEIFFAAMNTNAERINSDIYHSVLKNGIWSKPERLSINTLNYESHPHISKDGKTLLFTSDRPGGIGGLDIYAAVKSGDDFVEVQNLGDIINSDKDEKSPYLDENDNLLFASNGHGAKSYDIFKAIYDNEGNIDLRPLPSPINTEYNELGPAIYKEEIFLTSDRLGGCGGKDIYAFELCGPVFMEGTVYCEDDNIPIAGQISITNINTKEKRTLEIDDDGKIFFKAKSNIPYLLEYKNACNPNLMIKQYIPAQCNEDKTTKVQLNFKINPEMQYFTFEEYDIPFFVTGYYKPNTGENLSTLKMKFAYNLLGNDDSTRYIENPESKYDKYTLLVEKALDEAVLYVKESLNNLDSKCKTENRKLEIRVEGFADPRPFTNKAVYADVPITSAELGINAFPGNKMDNKLLSYLRAYFTAKYINDMLDRQNVDTSKLIWQIEGKGVDKSNVDDKLKRRVNISIKPINSDISISK